uniref:Uncharacterized protein n=2 Tax=Moniliophthora roreri TaxID=221103 RepID=A0A0W0GA30_MONRR
MDNKGENGLTGKHACVRVVVESERIVPLCCYGENLVLFGFGLVTTVWDLVPSGIMAHKYAIGQDLPQLYLYRRGTV